MTATVFTLLSTFPLGAMIVSDFRDRSIAVRWLVAFGVVQILAAIAGHGLRATLLNIASNIALLTLLYTSLWLYVRVFRRNAFSSLYEAVGAGDLLFLPMLAPCFELHGYMLFLSASFMLSLVAWGVCRVLMRRNVSIPLVSTTGTCFIIMTVYGLLI